LGVILQSRTIRASDFSSSNTWQEFQLTFIVPENMEYGLEFRMQNLNFGIADLHADTIIVY
jgi:hypothetical protein